MICKSNRVAVYLIDNRKLKRIKGAERFFDIDFRLEQSDKCGNSLIKINEVLPWFRGKLELIREKEWKSNARHKAFDVILMFKFRKINRTLYK